MRKTYERALSAYQETSREAWASVMDSLADVDRRIVEVIDQEDGATCDRVEIITGFKHQTASAQIRHMAEAGLLVALGDKQPTRSGRAALVWRIPR